MRKGLIAGLVLLLSVMGALPALGHVSVSPKEAAKGATATFSFTVPNEERLHATVSIEIFWPDDVSFTNLTPQTKDGWTFTPSERSAKWSGGAIRGDLKETFNVTLGPLPNSESILFKAVQTYDNGVVVRWIDEQSGSTEPEHPAPIVKLTGAPASVATTTPATSSTSPSPSVAAPNDDQDDSANRNVAPLIFGALVLAGIGVGIAIGARRRTGPQSP